MDGKSDRLDAEQIARAVLGQTSTAIPKAKSGMVEVIRTLRVSPAPARSRPAPSRSTPCSGVMIGAPSPLRDELVVLTKRTLVNRCLRLRPESDDLARPSHRPGPAAPRRSQDRPARPGPPLEGTRRRDQDPQPAARSPRPGRRTRAGRAARRRRRDRRPVPRHRRRQRRADPQRGRLREALRRRSATRQQRTHQRPTPTQPRRRPRRQQRPLHRHHRPDAPPPAHPRLRRTTHRRRPQQTRDHPLPQALHRPRDLRQPAPTSAAATQRRPPDSHQRLDEHRSIERQTACNATLGSPA